MISPQYAAGFFDGEGCINISSTRNCSFVRILVVNTNKHILSLFKEKWGGDISENKRIKSNWKISYTWRLSHKSCLLFLEEIRPYLVIKAEQADAAFMFFKAQPGKGNKWNEESIVIAQEAINKIKTLNKKGVDTQEAKK